eukprot:GHRR01017688.1.p1 GENE.GHRR01017688.1~~GHRR01017688.1.p1  ORF type:complete len:347 (+),score=115.14 GHRR01017688.1:171-1211(+)
MSILIAVLLLSCACQLALTAGSTVILHDASRHILRPSVTHDYSYAAATAAVCAATGLVPPYQVDQDVDKQVAQIVQPNIFNRPKALLVLQLTGVPPDPDHLAQLLKSLEDGHTAQLHINSSSKAALLSSQLVQAVDDIVAANFDVDVKLLDHSGLQGCDPSTCLSGHLSAAVQRCGGKVLHLNAAANSESQQQQQHPHGSLSSLSLQLPGLEQPLQLSHAAARLFALELAGLQGSTQHVMQELKQQTGQQYGQQQDEEFIVYESTIVSLQGLRALHPEGSAELAAAESALVTAMNHVVSQLKDKYGEDILIQVSMVAWLLHTCCSTMGLACRTLHNILDKHAWALQ